MELGHPTGTVTLVFTDIESSSELSQRHGVAFEAARDAHFSLLREAALRWNGFESETAGDAIFLVFAQADHALAFALDAQLAMAAFAWPHEIGEVRVRIGMHTGEPFIGQDNGRPTFRGPATNLAARVQAAAHGGQVLLSQSTSTSTRALPPDAFLEDRGVHRLKGVGEERLWQLCHSELRREFPPLLTLSPERHNLPPLSTPLVGRDGLIAAWRDTLLEPATRLLTLCGFGGMGKTRGALQLAENCVPDFRDGVWWVELSEAREAEAMILRIAAALRLAPLPGVAVFEQLAKFLRERELLLILDNTEQIPDAAPAIQRLLLAAPRLKLLVTSRQTLGLQAEVAREVPPLPEKEARRLFAERARARRPDFEISDSNRDDVSELCRRLEGVPLAIELAAGRSAGLSPREILGHLDQRFRLLQTRSPELPPRQRALRGTIDWSHELLASPEQDLFAQVSVFARGFTLEAAQEVCEVEDVLEGVLELRHQSLLRAETDEVLQQTRYFMLESVREYAGEKLAASPGARGIHQSHGKYFLAFAQARLALLRTPGEASALEQAEANVDNLRAALAWARGAEVPELSARLALALGAFLRRRGRQREAVAVVQGGLEAARGLASAQPRLLAELWREHAGLDQDQLAWDSARTGAARALKGFVLLGDLQGQADAHNLLGLCAKHDGDLPGARATLGRALSIFVAAGDEVRAAIVRNNLGLAECEIDGGDRARAASELQEALRLRRARGDQRGTAETLNNLGVMAKNADDLPSAWSYYEEALRYEAELGHSIGVARALYNLSEIAEARGSLALALRLSSAAQSLFGSAGSPLQRYPSELIERLAPQVPHAPLDAWREGWKDLPLDELIARALEGTAEAPGPL